MNQLSSTVGRVPNTTFGELNSCELGLGSLTAANWVSFEFKVSDSSCEVTP